MEIDDSQITVGEIGNDKDSLVTDVPSAAALGRRRTLVLGIPRIGAAVNFQIFNGNIVPRLTGTDGVFNDDGTSAPYRGLTVMADDVV